VTIKISDAKRSDSGAYKVVAKNTEGEVEAEINLKVTGVRQHLRHCMLVVEKQTYRYR